MPIKIAMIGAGSIGFTRRLLADILSVPELAETTFAFMDISARNLDMVAQLCRRDIAANHLPAQSEATTDQRAADATESRANAKAADKGKMTREAGH
jgi:alpha-galactosidase